MISTFDKPVDLVPASESKVLTKAVTWEEFCMHPPEYSEWVDGEIKEKTGMSFKHSIAQGNLYALLYNFCRANQLAGKTVLELLCKTHRQTRRPDIAFISSEQIQKYPSFNILAECFPWIAEVASPDDSAEMLFAKSREYLDSGCREVWLLFPETQIVMINFMDDSEQIRWLIYQNEGMIASPIVFNNFTVSLAELFQ
jgi:Uma2 family endonuclease